MEQPDPDKTEPTTPDSGVGKQSKIARRVRFIAVSAVVLGVVIGVTVGIAFGIVPGVLWAIGTVTVFGIVLLSGALDADFMAKEVPGATGSPPDKVEDLARKRVGRLRLMFAAAAVVLGVTFGVPIGIAIGVVPGALWAVGVVTVFEASVGSTLLQMNRRAKEVPGATGPPPDKAEDLARTRELAKLDEIGPQLIMEVHSYRDHADEVRHLVGDAAALRATSEFAGNDSFDWADSWVVFLPLVMAIAGRWWFGSHFRWWDYILVVIVTFFLGAILVSLFEMLGERLPPRFLLWSRLALAIAGAAAAIIFTVRWRNAHPATWQIVAVGMGLLLIPIAGDAVRDYRNENPEDASEQLRQLLAIDFLELLGIIHPPFTEGKLPPLELVKELEAKAKGVLVMAERLAQGRRWADRDVKSQIRDFGGSVAAGLRWHKQLVIFPPPDASAVLFASFGYGLVAATMRNWQKLMFEPAPSPVQSLWRRYRSRLAVFVVLIALTGATYVFPNALPGANEAQLRGTLVLTAIFALLTPIPETIKRSYEAFVEGYAKLSLKK